MPTFVTSDRSDFAKLEKFIKPHEAAGRTDSAALLIWFLETVFRLDDIEAQDAVCDRKHDAGVDALSVRDDLEEVFLFQAKRKQRLPATLGDTDLKEFVGSLKQFQSEASVRKLMSTTTNTELLKLLQSNNVPEKIGKGYTLRPVFVCNIAANDDARNYLEHAEADGYDIDLWDLARLGPVLTQLSREWFVRTAVQLTISPKKAFIYGPKPNPSLVYAAIRAKELVKMPGIDDTRIFAQNVRLWLGNTRVNNELLETVRKKAEHRDFLTFHNGLTIVSKKIAIQGTKLSLKSYSVCNGCQSLRTFYDNRRVLTEDLELLVRIVRVGEDRKLPELIAYRTNNQNAISLRDLSANDKGQIRLKAEFDSLYGNDTSYVIKRGDHSTVKELQNEWAGRLLLAVYCQEPWSCHQKYRVFGDLENKIFGYETDAPRVRLVQLMDDLVDEELIKVSIERIRKYTLTRFLILYLVAEILRQEVDGIAVLNAPKPYLSTRATENDKEHKMLTSIKDQLEFVLTELNFIFEERGSENYDYKTEFKSPRDVGAIRAELVKAYVKDKRMGRVKPFCLPK